MSTPKNVILAETKEPPIYIRSKYLASNFLNKVLSFKNHPLCKLLEEVGELRDNPTSTLSFNSPLIDCYDKIYRISHLCPSHEAPVNYTFKYEDLLFTPNTTFEEGYKMKTLADLNPNSINDAFNTLFESVNSETFIFTDGSKNETIFTVDLLFA